jgi:hypothetical protein
MFDRSVGNYVFGPFKHKSVTIGLSAMYLQDELDAHDTLLSKQERSIELVGLHIQMSQWNTCIPGKHFLGEHRCS